MKIILRTCDGREHMRDWLVSVIPDLLVVQDQRRDAMDTFLRAKLAAGTDPAIHLEDDIVLTENWYQKVTEAVAERPGDVIQFFSRRYKDKTEGSRYEPGSNFSFNVCYYLPYGMSKAIHEYTQKWGRLQEHPTGYDIAMQDYFRENKIRYWVYVPSLVQHRVAPSLINPKRSTKRQSDTFEG